MNALIAPYGEHTPVIPASCFVAPGVVVLGEVTLGEEANIWFNSTVRGDVHSITIGAATNIQDNSVLHVTGGTHPLVIGARVTCGHAVRLHGCTIEDEALVGIGAIVLDGAVIRSGSMVAAGALVPPGMEVPSGVVVAGVPAKIIRDIRESERDGLAKSAAHYIEYARSMRSALAAAH